jgi:hypothetical protein
VKKGEKNTHSILEKYTHHLGKIVSSCQCIFWQLFYFKENPSKLVSFKGKDIFELYLQKKTDFFENIGIVLAKSKSECRNDFKENV